jgi:hypothetical protein
MGDRSFRFMASATEMLPNGLIRTKIVYF